MSTLDDDIRAAKELGISYGKYKSLTYNPQKTTPSPAPTIAKKPKRKPRKFTDQQAFELWQAGHTDAQIGAAVGVSRAYIQRWRDQLELPSTSKTPVDTKKYRLAVLQDGTYAIKDEL